tara:strand:- start:1288 stop:2685 length:1398 start_codon:yes stop_codon:yes gene_type:complete
MRLIIDQGTSSTKAFLFNSNGKIVYQDKIKHDLYRPSRNHVECNASEILNACKILIIKSIKTSTNQILSMGLSVQRSTFLFWDRKNIVPVTKALSWQDSRAIDIVEKMKEHSDWVYRKTGLPLSPHFGGPKFQKMIKEIPSLKNKVKDGSVIFGTLSSYITHALTKNLAIDHTIASRTLLLDINSCRWSNECLELFSIPEICLPKIKPTFYNYGKVLDYDFNLQCVIGDQQAALIGQNGFTEKSIGMNFGTSASILYNSGHRPIMINGLITSVLFSSNNKKIYVSEGTINACNSLFYYLEKILNIKHSKMSWDERCKNINTEGLFITGFSGIAAPYWVSRFDDIYHNLNKNNKNEVIRAGMESIGYLVNDIIDMLNNNISFDSALITASGGGARNSLLQFISDLTGQIISRPKIRDKTATGVFRILNSNYTTKQSDDSTLFKPIKDRKKMMLKIKKWREIASSLG